MNIKIISKYFLILSVLMSSSAFAENKKEFSILAFGDIADCQKDREQGVKDIANIVKHQKFDFMIHLGDVAYPDATVEELNNCYGKYFNKYKSKIFPIAGNHEYNIEKGIPYFQFFTSNIEEIKKQENYEIVENKGTFPKYYSFNKNGWSLIFLDIDVLPTLNGRDSYC